MKRFWMAAATLLVAASPAFSQVELKPEAFDRAVGRTALWTSQHVVYQEFRGPVSEIEKNMRVFMGEFFKQGLLPTKRTSPVISIFPQPPKSADDPIAYELGFAVPSEASVQPPLKTRSLSIKSAARYTHAGNYDRLFEVHRMFDNALKKAKKTSAGPVIHLYHVYDAPAGVAKRTTEVLIPVGR